MANRVIYNAQDLFFGLASGVDNYPIATGYLSDGSTGTYEVLKRLHRVQSFSYDITANREDVGLIGKSSFDSMVLSSPPEVGGSISYFLEGLNNEKKMGFNVMTSGSSSIPNKEFTYDFVSGNKKQNIYLAINKTNDDAKDTATSPSEIPGLIASGRANEIGVKDPQNLGLLVFQNAYINSYAVDITVGNYPKVDVGFVADNAIYLATGSGFKTPYINSQTAEVEHGDKEILIPKNYARENPHFDVNHTFRPGDVSMSITKRAAKEDILIENDMEGVTDFRGFHNASVSLTSSMQYQGLQSLAVTQSPSIVNGNYGGAYVLVPVGQMVIGEYYTYEFYIKANTTKPGGELLKISQDHTPSPFARVTKFVGNNWTKIKVRSKLAQPLSSGGPREEFNIYFPSAAGLEFWVDSFKVYKDAENEPIKFYKDIFQSLKINVPLARENTACVGYKYYVDRSLTLPVKTTISIDMLESGANFGESGNFLDNLRRDEEYDISLTFTDSQGNQGMKYNAFGAKFDGASYSLDIGSNKTASVNFTMSNDYDFGRSVITAEGKGLFILDYLVDDNLNILTADNGDYMIDDYPHLY